MTRGQMAAFMRRFANASNPQLVGSEGSDRLIRHETWVALDSVTMTAPADGGALLLNGSAIFTMTPMVGDLDFWKSP